MKQYIKQPFRCLWSCQVEFALSWSGYTESADCTFLPVSTFLFCLIFLSFAVMDTFAKYWFGLKSPPESTLARRIKTRAGCATMTCLAVTISNSSIDRLSCVWYHGLLSPASNSADSHYHHTQLVLLKNIHSFSQSLNPKKRKKSICCACSRACFCFFPFSDFGSLSSFIVKTCPGCSTLCHMPKKINKRYNQANCIHTHRVVLLTILFHLFYLSSKHVIEQE